MITFHRVLLAALGLAGAAVGSQAPAFSDQYLQSLGGRLDQARLHAARIAEAAEDQDLSVDAYVGRFAASEDPAVQGQARIIESALEDAVRLDADYQRLAAAGPGLRPLLVLGQLDTAVARATARRFTPASPFSLAGLMFAAAGGCLFLASYFGGAAGLARWRRQRTKGEATAGDERHA